MTTFHLQEVLNLHIHLSSSPLPVWHAGALQACDEVQQQGYGVCTIMAGRFEFDQTRPLRLVDGLGIVISIPPRLTDQEWQELFFARFRAEPAPDMHFPEDDNALNLMARSSAQLTAAPQATSSSSTDRSRSRSAASADPINAEEEDTWRLAMIYTVEGDAVQVDVPWTDVQLRVERVAQAFSLARDQVTELHYVAATPQDLLQEELECFLLQRLQGAPSSSLLSLVLADIEYRPDHRGFWLPHHCNAISVIRLLGYEGHCAPRYRRCSLWHNNRVIDIEANHLLHFASGDYIRFHLPWSPDDDFDYLFGSDCPLESTEQTSLFQKYAGVIATDGGQFHSTATHQCSIRTRSIHERRPLRDLLPPALQEQLQLLWNRPHLRQRFPDRSEVMLFDTWFLSNRGFHRCDIPRLAALPADTSTWIHRLRQVWSDRADAMRVATLVLVQPGPPDQRHGGHLILLQDVTPNQAGCLFSQHGPGAAHEPQMRFAALFEQPMTLESFLTQTGMIYICGQPRVVCQLAWAGFYLQAGFSIHIVSGTHLQLSIEHLRADHTVRDVNDTSTMF